jgi:hypothetical protein
MGERLALIEVLDHDGRVLHAVPVVRWPVTVGRALDCDVVLHDPHVAAHHATLDMADTGVALSVGDSVNGASWHGRTLAAGESALLPDGTVWTAGRSALRVRRAGEALAPEEPLAHPARRRRAWLTAGGALALFAWVGTLLWLDNDPGARWDEYLPVLLGTVSGAALWCALWGLGSKLFQRRFSFMPHLRVLLSFALASLVVDALLAIASYALSWPLLSHLRGWVSVGMGAALLASHTHLLVPSHGRTVGLAFGALCALAIGIGAALDWRHNGRVFNELYATTLPPPALRMAGAQPPSVLIEDLRSLKPGLDRRAKEDEAQDRGAPDEDAKAEGEE